MNSSKGKLSSHGPWVHGHNFLPFCQAENRPPLTCFSALRLGFPIAAMQCLGLIAGTFSCTGGGAIPWMGKKDVVRCIPFGFGTGKFFFFIFFAGYDDRRTLVQPFACWNHALTALRPGIQLWFLVWFVVHLWRPNDEPGGRYEIQPACNQFTSQISQIKAPRAMGKLGPIFMPQ